MKNISKLCVLLCAFITLFLEAGVIRVSSLSQLNTMLKSSPRVVIKFYADFCPPCKSFAPIYKQVSQESSFTSVTFVEVNTQEARDISLQYGVRSIPTLIFVNNQQVVGRETGLKNASSVKSLLNNYFSL